MKHFICFLAVLFLVSCTGSNTIYRKPADLIPKDTLKLLLTDMYLAVSAQNIKDKCSNRVDNYLPLVYEKYKIDSTRFYTSNTYYTSKIEAYKSILKEVRSRLQKEYDFFDEELTLKDSLKKQKKQLKSKRKDSIKKIKEYEKSEGYIPMILEELKKDTTRFYNKNAYTYKIEEYNLILKKE